MDDIEDYTEDNDFTYDEGDDGGSYYCSVCNIRCSGPQPYQMHLNGQKHKRKQARAHTGDDAKGADPVRWWHCEICDVTCTGKIGFKAHLRGAKHAKTLKLQRDHGQKPNGYVAASSYCSSKLLASTASTAADLLQCVEAVGEDFLEPVASDGISVVHYYCKLCDCPCPDKSAANCHIRGRRHRTQYKKKVCPDFDVDGAVVPKTKRANEEKCRKELMLVRQRVLWNIRAQYQSQIMPKKPEAVEIESKCPSPMFGWHVLTKGGGKVETLEDRFINAKHAMLQPSAEELASVLRIVLMVEKALKKVSDQFAQEQKSSGGFWTGTDGGFKGRNLQGVIRVGPFADSVLLPGERFANLVVLCEQKPTEYLIREIMNRMQLELKTEVQEKCDVLWSSNACLLRVSSVQLPITVDIAFTSTAMREANEEGPSVAMDPSDVLDLKKCLGALADVRHTKWFQARCLDVNCCTIMVRVMRDVRRRVDSWKPLNYWALQLLIEKVLVTAGAPLSPGEAFHRIFEAVSSGILLPDGPGLLDPCEKDIADAASDMSLQEREDITTSAHKALRLMAFEKLYRILGVSPNIDEAECEAKAVASQKQSNF